MSMSTDIAAARQSVCERCDEQCAAFKAGAVVHADPCAQCPRAWPSRWGVYGGECDNVGANRGLGDVVASLAQPIARRIDSVFGTNLQNCGGCKQRQEALNRILPNI